MQRVLILYFIVVSLLEMLSLLLGPSIRSAEVDAISMRDKSGRGILILLLPSELGYAFMVIINELKV
jgi:hypothetical protein